MHRILALVAFLSLIPLPVLAEMKSAPAAPDRGQPRTRVHFRILDGNGQITPAMVCITGATKGEVRLPPEGRVATQPSRTAPFYSGFQIARDKSRNLDRNWIGPIRKTMGKGDNDDRAYVYELRPSMPYWTEPVMYEVLGDFDIDLPPGKWRVAAVRGIENIPVTQEFTTAAGESEQTRTLEIKPWTDMPARGWYAGDVHVHHTTMTDEHREFLLSWAVASDLNVINILSMGDHKTLWFPQPGYGKPFRTQRGNYALAGGQEEPRSTFGHIIGLNINQVVRDTTKYDYYDLAFRKIHQQPEAMVGFAHLAWNGCSLPRGFPWYVTTGEIDFVELLQFTFINSMDYYDYLNLGFHLTAAAGSDVPWGSTIGEVRTYVYTGRRAEPGKTTLDLDEWFAAFKKGNTFVTNGPMLEFTVDGQLPGSQLDKHKSDKVKVVARAFGHPPIGLPKALSIVANEGVVREVVNPDGRSELVIEFDYPLEASRWLVASTTCDNNAVAHTTPVYVSVEGRPTWCPHRGPLVIEKQLKAMGDIGLEFPATDKNGQAIHERLENARLFYKDLRARMQSETSK
jgi:hypothetical protein